MPEVVTWTVVVNLTGPRGQTETGWVITVEYRADAVNPKGHAVFQARVRDTLDKDNFGGWTYQIVRAEK